MTLEVWDGAFEDMPLRTLGAVTTYIASASYGLPYLPANAQSDAVPGVGALALSAAMLCTFQGTRPDQTIGYPRAQSMLCARTPCIDLALLSTYTIIKAVTEKINLFL